MKNRLLLAVLAIVALFGQAHAQEILYPTTIGNLDATAIITGQGSVSGLKDGEEARLQTITFQETEFQTIKSIKEEMKINGKTLHPQYILDKFGNKYVQFHIKENGEFEYKITANIVRKALAFNISDHEISEPKEEVKEYTQPTEKIESNSTEILTVANNKIFGNNYVGALAQTINWVNDYVTYPKPGTEEYNKYYLQQYSAVETLIKKMGVCDEYAELGAALLRAKKIPTRIAIGITYDRTKWGNHAWIETYHEKIDKWIPSDPTFREAGFVDAMHLKMGAFDDVTNSKAKCFYPSTAACTIETQIKHPEVTINEKEYMANIKIDLNAQELKANAWNEIQVTLTNLTSSTLSAPIKIQEINGVRVQEENKSVIIAPGKKQSVIFKVLPKIELSENQVAKGKLVFYSLAEPYQEEITVIPNENPEEGGLIVKDITPIAHEGTLKIQITATNYYSEDKELKISIKGKNYTKTKTEKFLAESTKTITEEIINYVTEPYDINLTTPEKIILAEIIPIKTTSTNTQIPKQQTIIVQNIAPTKQTQNTQTNTINNPIAILMGLLSGITVMLLGLFLVKKKYV